MRPRIVLVCASVLLAGCGDVPSNVNLTHASGAPAVSAWSPGLGPPLAFVAAVDRNRWYEQAERQAHWSPVRPSVAPKAPPDGSGVTTSVSVGGFLACVKRYESGGNYSNADTGHNGHYGAYQFAPSTWNGTAGRHGRGDLVGVRPDRASPADQDQMAVWLLHDSGPGQWAVAGRCR